MKKKITAALVAGGLALGLAASPVSAAPKGDAPAHGHRIKAACGLSFGQLRQASPHPVTPSKGAAYFATNVLGNAPHCD